MGNSSNHLYHLNVEKWYKMSHMKLNYYHKSFWAFTAPRKDYGRVFLILGMVNHKLKFHWSNSCFIGKCLRTVKFCRACFMCWMNYFCKPTIKTWRNLDKQMTNLSRIQMTETPDGLFIVEFHGCGLHKTDGEHLAVVLDGVISG